VRRTPASRLFFCAPYQTNVRPRVKEDKAIEVSTRSAEAAEAQINAFIERRDGKRRQSEGERLEAELYAESVRRFQERAQAEMRSRWIDYHRHLQILHQNLADEHEAEAEKLTGTAGKADRGEGGLLG
jgi:hypothetical protein